MLSPDWILRCPERDPPELFLCGGAACLVFSEPYVLKRRSLSKGILGADQVDQLEEQQGLVVVEPAVADLVDNQAGMPGKAVQHSSKVDVLSARRTSFVEIAEMERASRFLQSRRQRRAGLVRLSI